MDLHHIGFVVASIDAAVEGFQRSLQCSWDGKVFHDPTQDARVTFLAPLNGSGSLVELVEPADEKSPVHALARRGGGLHHLCYEVDDLEQQLQASREQRHLLVKRPAPAVAFEGRRIAWVYTRQKLLLEYLERAR